jgi:hypothetical protein
MYDKIGISMSEGQTVVKKLYGRLTGTPFAEHETLAAEQ